MPYNYDNVNRGIWKFLIQWLFALFADICNRFPFNVSDFDNNLAKPCDIRYYIVIICSHLICHELNYCFSYSFRKLIKLCKLYHTNVLSSTNRLFHTGIQNTPLSKNIILHFLSSSRCLHSNTLLFRSLKYLLQHFNNKVGSRSLIGP